MPQGGHPDDPDIRCDRCRYYACADRHGTGLLRGECRIRPPRRGGRPWPNVEPDDWCRRWTPLPLDDVRPEAD